MNLFHLESLFLSFYFLQNKISLTLITNSNGTSHCLPLPRTKSNSVSQVTELTPRIQSLRFKKRLIEMHNCLPKILHFSSSSSANPSGPPIPADHGPSPSSSPIEPIVPPIPAAYGSVPSFSPTTNPSLPSIKAVQEQSRIKDRGQVASFIGGGVQSGGGHGLELGQ